MPQQVILVIVRTTAYPVRADVFTFHASRFMYPVLKKL